MIKNLRGFEVICLGATNTKGTRVKIKDLRFNKTKIINYSYEFNSAKDDAEVYLKSLGIPCLYGCETKNGSLILSDNFEIQIK
jgi:hypothetical protein